MLEYQKQNSSQTLSEAMAEYTSNHSEHFKARTMTAQAEDFFSNHDVAHVVFGCDISLNDELVVKISSMFGTTAGLGVLKGYNLPEAKDDYVDLGFKDICLTTLSSFILIPQTLWRCIRMQKRWEWKEHQAYLDIPLYEIRQSFGIRVAHNSAA